MQSIGYVLFHTRKDVAQHLFRVKNARLVKSLGELPIGIYKNVNTTDIYVVVDVDMSNEMKKQNMLLFLYIMMNYQLMEVSLCQRLK